VLDVGCGDGGFFRKYDIWSKSVVETTVRRHIQNRFGIERSLTLAARLPEDVFLLGTDFYAQTLIDKKVDCIFSNPPYFEDSLNAPEERRNNARHTSTGLSYREILDFASQRLTDNGRVAFVLPAETEAALCRHARMNGLHLFRIVRVRTVPRKEPSRIIAEFSRTRIDTPEDTVLTIQNEGKYTEEYLSLMRDFYLFA
jgi:tRNA1(Val) A37 N6-methylase TrmN6